VVGILDEYRANLPLTVRQVFYRLVAVHDFPKDRNSYVRLGELLVNARRTTRPEFNIPFDSIRDDGTTVLWPVCYDDPDQFLTKIRGMAATYGLDRQAGQEAFIELWVEAAGMVPQLSRVVNRYGVPVISSGGFDSVTLKHEAAVRAAARTVPTRVLYVGDWDKAGRDMLANVTEDVPLLEPGADRMTFTRVAVTPSQIETYDLPEKLAADEVSVQAEALPPNVLAAEVRQVVVSLVDDRVRASLLARETVERNEIIGRFQS
jgi:hypothetical protein